MAATRFERVAEFRRKALRDAVPFRGAVPEIIERSVRLELAAAIRITERSAERLMHMAEALTERYPRMLESLASARATERHAQIFVDLVDTLPIALRAEAQPRAVELAETLAIGAFRRELRALVDSFQAPTLEERHRDAVADRRVVVEPAEDGMAWLMTFLPAVEAHAIFDRTTRIAKTILDGPDETRTLPQVRADVIADLLIDGHADAHPAAARGIQAHVVVTVPALSLLDDEVAATHPAVVEGVGPIPISRARELCAGQKHWMRVLTTPKPARFCRSDAESIACPSRYEDSSPGGPDDASAPGADTPPIDATSTTTSPGARADTPPRAISRRCAADTTPSGITEDG